MEEGGEGGKRETDIQTVMGRGRERERQTGRQTDRGTEKDRYTGRGRERKRWSRIDRGTEKEKDRYTGRERERKRGSRIDRGTEKERHRKTGRERARKNERLPPSLSYPPPSLLLSLPLSAWIPVLIFPCPYFCVSACPTVSLSLSPVVGITKLKWYTYIYEVQLHIWGTVTSMQEHPPSRYSCTHEVQLYREGTDSPSCTYEVQAQQHLRGTAAHTRYSCPDEVQQHLPAAATPTS